MWPTSERLSFRPQILTSLSEDTDGAHSQAESGISHEDGRARVIINRRLIHEVKDKKRAVRASSHSKGFLPKAKKLPIISQNNRYSLLRETHNLLYACTLDVLSM